MSEEDLSPLHQDFMHDLIGSLSSILLLKFSTRQRQKLEMILDLYLCPFGLLEILIGFIVNSQGLEGGSGDDPEGGPKTDFFPKHLKANPILWFEHIIAWFFLTGGGQIPVAGGHAWQCRHIR